VKIKKIVQDIPNLEVRGSKEIDVTGICSDSRKVAPGNLFIARKGSRSDGASFSADAVKNGAVAVLISMYDPFLQGVVQLIHPDVRSIESVIASRYYRNPSNELFCVAITGTNGKTTTSYLVKHLLNSIDKPAGLMGTIETIIGTRKQFSSLTTPDVVSNQKSLREMVRQGCRSAVLEASSHGLDQGRLEEIHFDAAIFTNLTPEHLDYHCDIEKYARAKRALFASLEKSEKPHKIAILNADSPWSERMIEGYTITSLFYGLSEKATLRGSDIVCSDTHSRFRVTYREERETFSVPLIGDFNVLNILATCALGVHLGYSLKALSLIFQTFPQVSGRMQRIASSTPFSLFVDFAHTEDALLQVLQTLQKVTKERIITVFGCGGDRDKEKRAKMGAVSDRYSTITIITSDNPRNEDPEEIAKQILQGFSSQNYVVELDRKKAIEKAVCLAKEGDVIVIAGRGHEESQILADQTLPFNDAHVAQDILRKCYS